MKLSKLFKRPKKDEETRDQQAESRKHQDEEIKPPQQDSESSPIEAENLEEPQTAPPSTEEVEPETDIEHIASMFGSIQSVLDEDESEEPDGETVDIPASAILKNVPEKLRGPNYDEHQFPAVNLALDREQTLKQLKTGRVTAPVEKVQQVIPDGWIVNGQGQEIQVDLPAVVAAIPPEMIGGAQQESQSLRDLEGAADLFHAKSSSAPISKETPDETVAPAPSEPEPSAVEAAEPEEEEADAAAATEPETGGVVEQEDAAAPMPPPTSQHREPVEVEKTVPPVAPSPVVPEPPATPPTPPEAVEIEPRSWSGAETSLSAGAGVDVNTASVEHLTTVPGVGESRARQILGFRREHGPFNHIYELMRLPGIGPGLFRQMTGLSPTTGRNRRENLNRLLGFEAEADPSLQKIATAFKNIVGAEGCILGNQDGIPLAFTPEVADDAERYAAINTQLFSRTEKYLHGITGSEVECISLPVASPPLMLFSANNIHLVLVQGERLLSLRDFRKATSIATELGWMLGARAVVRDL